MIDKRFNPYSSLFGSCPLSFTGDRYEIYLSHYSHDYASLTDNVYLWQAHVYNGPMTIGPTEMRFQTYMEAEKWLREGGFL